MKKKYGRPEAFRHAAGQAGAFSAAAAAGRYFRPLLTALNGSLFRRLFCVFYTKKVCASLFEKLKNTNIKERY